ncbi:hypothetical protein [Acinetobacter sp.]|uniref:hypothetical protein n=1 Tax=Acinetobacter sp. TaxID=472 RepID=UPI003B0095BD
MKKIFFLSFILLGSVHAANAETLIPRSVDGDKGKYYLLESKRNGNIITAIHKRVGVYDTYYTKTETNCSTMKMRELGGSDVSVKSIKNSPTKWFDLVPGSSKSDLANFVCRKYK